MPVSRIPRRAFIKGITATSLLPLLSSNLMGCSDSSDRSRTVPASFRQGVASGDPLSDAVIIWTRAVPDAEPGPVRVSWQVASDETFVSIVAEGGGITDETVDYTVKVAAGDFDAVLHLGERSALLVNCTSKVELLNIDLNGTAHRRRLRRCKR